jgi:hypothetical protein
VILGFAVGFLAKVKPEMLGIHVHPKSPAVRPEFSPAPLGQASEAIMVKETSIAHRPDRV